MDYGGNLALLQEAERAGVPALHLRRGATGTTASTRSPPVLWLRCAFRQPLRAAPTRRSAAQSFSYELIAHLAVRAAARPAHITHLPSVALRAAVGALRILAPARGGPLQFFLAAAPGRRACRARLHPWHAGPPGSGGLGGPGGCKDGRRVTAALVACHGGIGRGGAHIRQLADLPPGVS